MQKPLAPDAYPKTHRFHWFSRPSPREGDRRAQKTHSRNWLRPRSAVDRSRRQTRGARARTRRRRSRTIYGIANVGTARHDARVCVRNRGDVPRRPRCGFTGAGRRELHQRARRVRAAQLGLSFTTTTTTKARTQRARMRRAKFLLRLRFVSRVATTGPTNGRPDPAGHHDEAGPTRRERPWRACTRQGRPDSTNRREGTASTAREREREGPDGA